MNQLHHQFYLSSYTETKGIDYGKRVAMLLQNSDL